VETLINTIRKSIIGDQRAIKTPFGTRPLIYADYTASGRSLSFIEDYIRQQVLPFYANTHSETSFTGARTAELRHRARQQIRQAINAGEDDCIIFTGSGATAAIHKLIDVLNLRLPNELSQRYQFDRQIPEHQRPVVFIGPYEHHSNDLPWRESIATLVTIPLDSSGQLDCQTLEFELGEYQHRPLKIGSFSAASNVTGIKTDIDKVTELLHRYHTLSFWDYAAAAPYMAIDVLGEQSSTNNTRKDAVFISPHKFIGGPGTPGILVVNQRLLDNAIPSVVGGGTVSFVSQSQHRYLESNERREEAGTPAIIESIRAGLVFQLQQTVGFEEIEHREQHFRRAAIARLQAHSNIEILGEPHLPSLAIISFAIRNDGNSRDRLHYGFVVALLNDLFGIQARGGCSCAGPYGHQLLNISSQQSQSLERAIRAGEIWQRPGWTRLNFNYFIDEETFNYLLDAILFVADYGHRFLSDYQMDASSGVWRHRLAVTESLDRSSDALDFHQLDSIPADETTATRATLAEVMRAAFCELEKLDDQKTG